MARRWTTGEESNKYKELFQLYITENKSIGKIGKILNLKENSIYDRLLRLGIKPQRHQKLRFNNKRNDILIPKEYSPELSEFIGILLGDGHLTPTQVTVTLGNKEISYVNYTAKLINKLFGIEPNIIKTRKGFHVIYFGSTVVVRWLLSMGLVFNKVKSQVDVPTWIFLKQTFMEYFLKGFFDTDGSIYKLKFGIQIALTNRSLPILNSLRKCLTLLGFYPSKISNFRIYLTRRKDIVRFFDIIRPSNNKHQERYRLLSV